VIWVIPILFVLFNCVKQVKEYNIGNFWDVPKHFEVLFNWNYLVNRINIGSGMFNSFVYALVGSGLAVLFASLAAYSISSLRIRHKMFWFMFIYSGTIFPSQIYLIPLLKEYSITGLYDTKLGLIIFYTSICIPFSMFVMRNFFMGVPKELHEAARIDGASNFKIFYKIYMPIAKASASAVFLIQFTWTWNELMFGMTLSKSNTVRPVMTAVSLLSTDNTPALLLACIIASLPTILLFLILQKNFEHGLIFQGK
jgi:multiple sugar transport system permease protein